LGTGFEVTDGEWKLAEFEFTIVAKGLDHHAPDFEDRFYRNGCDDALVSVRGGLIHVDFARRAATLDGAVASALRNVLATGAAVVRVDVE
jgi:hypothetical protein